MHCLSPDRYLPYCQLAPNGELCLPTERSFKITRPLGQHWLVAVFTARRLAPAIADNLADPQPSFRKDALASLYHDLRLMPEQQWHAYRLAFHVLTAP